MNSQHYHSEEVYLNKNIDILKEIVDIEKFKKLDDRYMITRISKEENMKYEFEDNQCNVYYRSFGLNCYFNRNNLKTIAGFINPILFNKEDEDKFIYFMKNIFNKKNIPISSKYFRGLLRNILHEHITEGKYFKFNSGIYLRSIKNNNRNLIFMMVMLNA